MNIKISTGEDPEQPPPAGPASHRRFDLRALEASSTLYDSLFKVSLKKDRKESS